MSVEKEMFNTSRKEKSIKGNGSESYIASAHINSLSKRYNKLNHKLSVEKKNELKASIRKNFKPFIEFAKNAWSFENSNGEIKSFQLNLNINPKKIYAEETNNEPLSISNTTSQILKEITHQEKPERNIREEMINLEKSKKDTFSKENDLYNKGFKMIPTKTPMYSKPMTEDQKKEYFKNLALINRTNTFNKSGAMPSKEQIHISNKELEAHVIIKPKNPTPDTFKTREELIADLDKKGISRINHNPAPQQETAKPKKEGFFRGILQGLEKRSEKKEQVQEFAKQLKELQQLTLYQLDYSEQAANGLLEDKSKQIVSLYNKLQTEATSSVSKEAVDIKLTLSQIKDALTKAGFGFSKLGTVIAPNSEGFKKYDSTVNMSAGLTTMKSPEAIAKERKRKAEQDEQATKEFALQEALAMESHEAKSYLFSRDFVENDLATPLQNLQGSINSLQNIPQTPVELMVLQEFIDDNFDNLKNSFNSGLLLFSVEPNDETKLTYNPNTRYYEREAANNLLDVPKNYKSKENAELVISLLKKLNNSLTYTIKTKGNKFEILVTDPEATTKGFDDREYR